MTLDLSKNKFFVEGVDLLPDWEKDNKSLQKIKALLKSYLELDNVSFLFGAGSSINIGSVSIANIPKKIEDRLKATSVDVGGTPTKDVLYAEFISTIKELQKVAAEKRTSSGEIEYSLEKFLNYLVAQEYVLELNPAAVKLKYLPDLIRTIKQGLFELCDIEKLPNADWLRGDVKTNLDKNKSFYHEKFTKKILQRPLNLKRANVFTTNYDLAFEYTFDKLGVNFISGFSGFQKRTFKTRSV
ncbi:MAG: hypothetical protein IPP73_07660 [Chitinophagaceae bacterium]|nr:hypothetical protein [Chitinophagaceae bacterium]